jgi:PKD repeat protein
MRRRRLVTGLLGIAAVGAVVPIIVSAAIPSGATLPDLVSDPPARGEVVDHTYPDGTQALLLRFDGYIHNAGAGPLELRGGDRSGLVYGTVRQYVRTPTGMSAVDPSPGAAPEMRYEANDQHNHWHLMRIARYSLWNQARTAEVAPGMKVGFCLIDSERVGSGGPASPAYTEAGNNFCGQGETTRASLTIGVSAGWRDLYHRGLAFQWVDVSNVRPGVYWPAAEMDTEDVIAEADETNNGRAFAAAATTVPGYVAGAVGPVQVPAGGSATVTLTATTFGSPGTRRFRITSLPARGTLLSGTTTLGVGSVVTGPGITYRAAPGTSGPDSFGYAAYDATSQFPRTPATATASLVVGTAPAPSVTISGAPQTLITGASAQLSAQVSGATGGVTWSVDGIPGGGAAVGTITAGGLYTSPAAVPPSGAVTVRATSTAAPTASAEAVIAIQAAPAPDPAPDPGANLVRNPSFEAGTTGWGGWQGAVSRVQTTAAPDGVWVGRVTRSTGTSFTIDDQPDTLGSVAAGASYTASAYVRAAGPAGVGRLVTIRMRERDGGGAVVREWAGAAAPLGTAFQKLTVTATPLVAGHSLDVRVGQGGAVAGDAFDIDAIRMAAVGAGPPPPPPPPPNQPPLASFTVTPQTAVAGQQVSLADTSTDPDGTVDARAWDLDGDGAFDDATGPLATVTYATAGTRTVGLRVTDSGGLSASTTRAVSVTTGGTGSANLLANGSFEANTTGWSSWQGTLTRVALAGAPDGGWVARVARATGTGYTLNENTGVLNGTPAGTAIGASAWVAAANTQTAGRPVTLRLRERGPSGAVVREWSSPALALTSGFQRIEVTGVVQAAGSSIDARLSQASAVAGDVLYADDVRLTRG